MRSEFRQILEVFEVEIEGCRNVVGVVDNLATSLPALDLGDLYRHALAAAVAAFDTCIHSIVRTGILLQLQDVGPRIGGKIPISADLFRRWFRGDSSALGEIELAVREEHGRWTMQLSKDVADATKLVSDQPVWLALADSDSGKVKALKAAHDLIIKRRNQIVHESDIDPSTGNKWPIDSEESLRAITSIAGTGAALVALISAVYPAESRRVTAQDIGAYRA